NGNLWIPFSGYRSGNSTTAAFSNVGSVANMYYSVEYNSKYIDMGDNATVRSSYVTKSGGGQHFAYPSDALTVRCRAY
ncbi:MAG: hypothetical protein MJY62_06760, partial [Bacteroidales bacterium]|nr:hypothetical protein [Bacteroidales bacterium]